MFENYIGGRWLAPAQERYLVVPRHSPGVRACRVARSCAEDVDQALDAAHRARPAWSRLSPGERAIHLARMAQRGDHGLVLGLADCWDRGGSVFALSQRTTDVLLTSLTVPLHRLLAHFEGEDSDWSSSSGFSEVVKLAVAAPSQIEAVCRCVVPLLLDGHVLVVALLFGNESRMPVRLLALMSVIAECLPPGVLNLVTGLGLEAGLALVESPLGISSSEMGLRRTPIADEAMATPARENGIGRCGPRVAPAAAREP